MVVDFVVCLRFACNAQLLHQFAHVLACLDSPHEIEHRSRLRCVEPPPRRALAEFSLSSASLWIGGLPF
jgi:hypothetical protein